MKRILIPVFAVALASLGCASFLAANQPLGTWRPDYGYRPVKVAAVRPMGDVLLMLAFSGGGTRASALAYGVLEELRDTAVPSGRLLDEVDSITSVSGGSFTAAYYGLYGDGIFADFEKKMLRNDLQGGLIRNLLNPLNWFRLIGGFFDRSELAVSLYDRNVFDGATFADMEAARGPMIFINATDLAAGNTFTFFQPQFDLLCSDLTPFSVARAVTASSAVPGAFSPITLRNYAGTCGFRLPDWFDAAMASGKTDPRRQRAALNMQSYFDVADRPYVHLLDGGIADNIGLRVPLQNVRLTGGPIARLEELGPTHFRHVAVIVVNAEVHPKPKFSLAASAPGLGAVLGSISDTQIYSYNFDTIELMRDSLVDWSHQIAAHGGRRIDTELVLVQFDAIQDEEERAFFNAVPTTLSLPDATVDRLIEIGRRLLRESPEYQHLVESLREPPPAEPARGRARAVSRPARSTPR